MDFEKVHLSEDNWTAWEPQTLSDSDLLWFERLDVPQWVLFSVNFWWLKWAAVAAYFVGIFLCQQFMQNRTAYNGWKLTGVIVAYNVTVTIFSMLGLWRLSITFLPRLLSGWDGIHNTLCYRYPVTHRDGFWMLVVGWSKFFQFADTFFLILKKKPIQFTQIYHHSATALLVQLMTVLSEPILYWMGLINLFQHTVTYSFFACKALKIKLPKAASIAVLIIEITQMVVGLSISYYTESVLSSGEICCRHPYSVKMSKFIFSTFFLMALYMTYDFYSNIVPKKQSKDKES